MFDFWFGVLTGGVLSNILVLFLVLGTLKDILKELRKRKQHELFYF